MKRIQKLVITSFTFFVVLGVSFGISRSMKSKLFILHKVEVVHRTVASSLLRPVDDSWLIRLTGLAIGKVSIFDVDIPQVEQKLLSQEWIQDVRFQKKYPDTLVILITPREPKAVFQNPRGSLVYVDETGKVFGSVSLLSSIDLPMLSGFTDSAKIKDALLLIQKWERSDLNYVSWISSVIWDSERGFRVLVTYLMSNRGNSNRTMIDLGQEIDDGLGGKLFRLTNVIRFLSGKSIASRQIWADAGKKVVVKTVPGS